MFQKDLVSVGQEPLRLQLLGTWQLRASSLLIHVSFREQKLIALLALRGERSRSCVAGTLWPDSSEHHALLSLRAAVHLVQHRAPGLLDSRRSTLALSEAVSTDAVVLGRRAIQSARPPRGVDVDEAVEELRAPLLLADWYDDWVQLERDLLRNAQIKALRALADYAIASGDYQSAISAAGCAIELEPLLEASRARLIAALLATGHTVDALREYQRYRRLLHDELGVAPSSQLTQLFMMGEQGRGRDRASQRVARPVPALR